MFEGECCFILKYIIFIAFGILVGRFFQSLEAKRLICIVKL